MIKKTFKVLLIASGLYIVLCGILYFFQEKLIFLPQKLDKNYEFSFNHEFEEINIIASDGKLLNGLLFKAKKTNGLIFYLHGNAGSLESWGNVAKTYTDLNYDIFILDYRSYGKSEGKINSQEQLFADNQTAYSELIRKYSEKNTIILGYSIGTGMASKLASENNPKLLILHAPYYSLADLVKHKFNIFPSFLIKYKFSTNEYLKHCNMPVVIFHGDEDGLIHHGSSVKLKKEFKEQIKLITLIGQEHNGITDNEHYRNELKKILRK